MGTVTGTTLCTDALRAINIGDAFNAPSDEDLALALGWLNRMIDRWNADRLNIYYMADDSYAWTTSKQSYTIGPTLADFTAVRPAKIERANLIVVSTDPDYRKPLEVIDVSDYSEITVPAQSGSEPDRIYYKATYPNGTIYPWPYPENDADVLLNKLELFTWAQLSALAALSASIYLPPGYEDAITLSLAEKLCIPFEKAVPQALAREASKARGIIKSLNANPAKLKTRDSGIPTAASWS